MNTISASQMMELAEGLENSGKPFIWVIRPPMGFNLKGEFRAEWLPDGFEERTMGSKIPWSEGHYSAWKDAHDVANKCTNTVHGVAPTPTRDSAAPIDGGVFKPLRLEFGDGESKPGSSDDRLAIGSEAGVQFDDAGGEDGSLRGDD
ncbi:hypothetical protein U1Q18_002614 [Sarracenia purpurea var. burkii]